MATISAQQIGTGTLVTYSAVTASDQFLPDDDLVYEVNNASGSSMNVTFTDAGSTPGGNLGQALVVAVPAGQVRRTYVNRAFVNPTTGFITVAHSATATITAALVRV